MWLVVYFSNKVTYHLYRFMFNNNINRYNIPNNINNIINYLISILYFNNVIQITFKRNPIIYTVE